MSASSSAATSTQYVGCDPLTAVTSTGGSCPRLSAASEKAPQVIDRTTPSPSGRIETTKTTLARPTPRDLRHSKAGVDVRCLRPEDLQDRTHRRPRVAEAAEAALLDTGLASANFATRPQRTFCGGNTSSGSRARAVLILPELATHRLWGDRSVYSSLPTLQPCHKLPI